MNRERDTAGVQGGDLVSVSAAWSDYDGGWIYGDYEIDDQDTTELRSFEPGIGKVDPWRSAGSWGEYYHADMIGSTRFMTDSPASPEEPTPFGQVVYTAFGERIDGAHHRYGYAGAWGYQGTSSDDPSDPYLDFPFLHVGARYYDPATGRFLQRDPIGLAGGLNVYAYVGSTPTYRIDPSGSVVIQIGVGGSITLPIGGNTGGVSVQGDISIYVGSEGISVGITIGGGAGFGAYAGGGALGGAFSGGISDISGLSFELGGDVPLGSASGVRGGGGAYAGGQLSGGAGFGAAARYTANWTWVSPPVKDPWAGKRPPMNPCPMPSSCVCFVRETLIATDAGFIPIDEVRVGDRFPGFDIGTSGLSWGVASFAGVTGFSRDFVDVRLPGEVIRSTPDHPYFVLNRGWVCAQELEVGDELRTIDARSVPVQGIQRTTLDDPIPVYDLVGRRIASFFAGANRVLVHSVCAKAGSIHVRGGRASAEHELHQPVGDRKCGKRAESDNRRSPRAEGSTCPKCTGPVRPRVHRIACGWGCRLDSDAQRFGGAGILLPWGSHIRSVHSVTEQSTMSEMRQSFF